MPPRSKSRPRRRRSASAAKRSHNADVDRSRKARLAETVGIIVARHSDPGRILELYYWSREAGLYELIRAVRAINEEAREAVRGFLTMASDPHSIAVVQADSRVLTLAAPTAQAPNMRDAA